MNKKPRKTVFFVVCVGVPRAYEYANDTCFNSLYRFDFDNTPSPAIVRSLHSHQNQTANTNYRVYYIALNQS